MAVDTAGRYVGTAPIKDNEAHQAERGYRAQLEARAGADFDGRMAAPPPLEKEAKRFGGRYRAGGKIKGTGGYDWFYELHPDEQARIRANWMTAAASSDDETSRVRGFKPDELEDRMPIKEWLSLTRRIDMSKAIARGRHINRNRFGNVDPDKVLLHGERIGKHRDRADEGESSRCHFFTDDDGVGHPIRAICEHQGPTFKRMTEKERRETYGDDEAF